MKRYNSKPPEFSSAVDFLSFPDEQAQRALGWFLTSRRVTVGDAINIPGATFLTATCIWAHEENLDHLTRISDWVEYRTEQAYPSTLLVIRLPPPEVHELIAILRANKERFLHEPAPHGLFSGARIRWLHKATRNPSQEAA